MYSRRMICTRLQLKGFLNQGIIHVNQQYLKKDYCKVFTHHTQILAYKHTHKSNNQKRSQEQNKRFIK